MKKRAFFSNSGFICHGITVCVFNADAVSKGAAVGTIKVC
jgi:hypothetical protein